MSRADKAAFDAMMAEIDSSDEDSGDERGNRRVAVSSAARNSGAKSSTPTGFGERGSAELNRPNVAAPKAPASTVPTYKMSKEEEEIASFGTRSNRVTDVQSQQEQLQMMKRWLMRPCLPGADPIQCYVERDKGSFGSMHPTYRCYQEGEPSKFLMAARKKAGSKTSYYLISLEKDPEDRGSESVLGKIRGNTVGSKYIIVDHGLAPEKTVTPSMLRKEFGIIQFEFDSGGPSKIAAFVPAVSSTGIPVTWQPTTDDDSIEFAVENGQHDKVLALQNKKPKWDETHGGHVLNFKGRVTESSVKNFQLCAVDPQSGLGEEVLLQFGRVDKNKFSMDVQYPLSPYQAFAMCVACMDGKLADRKGYEFFKKLTGDSSSSSSAAGAGSSTASTSTSSSSLFGSSSSSSAAAESKSNVEGSLEGNKSFASSIRQSLPSSQYLRDKISRSFK